MPNKPATCKLLTQTSYCNVGNDPKQSVATRGKRSQAQLLQHCEHKTAHNNQVLLQQLDFAERPCFPSSWLWPAQGPSPKGGPGRTDSAPRRGLPVYYWKCLTHRAESRATWRATSPILGRTAAKMNMLLCKQKRWQNPMRTYNSFEQTKAVVTSCCGQPHVQRQTLQT